MSLRFCLTPLLAAALAPVTIAAAAPATTIYVNAEVVTVNDAQPSAEALAVRDGLILAVGERAEVESAAGDNTRVIDVAGRTIVPGLIDAHGHISMTTMMMGMADVQPPPAGPVSDIPQLQKVLRDWHARNPDSPWILGWGYDDSLLAEGRHPTRDDLDAVSSDKPVLLTHVSGHLMACNSKCLAAAGITADTEDPSGGVIRRKPGGTEPDGVLEENAMWVVYGKMPQAPAEQQVQLMKQAQQYMASHGITTVQDGAMMLDAMAPLKQAAEAGLFYLDVVVFPMFKQGESIPASLEHSQAYDKGLRIGGIKLVLDGSPQGKTAWLTRPYLHPPHGQGADYVGYPTMEDDWVLSLISDAFRRGLPVIAHANGDAAADQLIDAVAGANGKLGKADRRTVMIHAQTAREDQVEAMKAQGMVPSYFVAHTFYWGDWHRDSVFGVERASRISPLKSTVDRGMRFTTHNDTPVVPPDMMRLLWAGVNRITRSGEVLGKDQRVEPLEALRSMTIHAAYQYFEEDSKGSIEPGKRADLVILSGNPLTVDPIEIVDIQVMETIKDGRSVYRRDSD